MNQIANARLSLLQDQLEQIEQLLAQEEAEAAQAILEQHDQQLRQLFADGASDVDVAFLQDLQAHHARLLVLMEQGRDLAASRMRNQRTTQSAVSAYQTSRNY